MTTPNGAIKFNNSTGHDTQSSGLGPAVAVYGSGASTTGASNVVTGINTAGVSPGDLLWVQSSSGRQFSIIASVDSSTQVTCDDNFDNTESGRTWAIGGKRATIDNADSRLLLTTDGAAKDLTVELENTGTDYYVTSSIRLYRITITGDPVTRTVVNSTHNGYLFGSYYATAYVKNLHLKCSATTKTSTIGICHTHHQGSHYCDNLVFDATDNWNRAFGHTALAAGGMTIRNTKVYNTITAVHYTGATAFFENCIFKDNQNDCIQSYNNPMYIYGCQFLNTGSIAIKHIGNPGQVMVIANCIFNGGSIGLHMYTYTQAWRTGYMANCILANFTTQAVTDGTSYTTGFSFLNNAFYNNAQNYARGESVAFHRNDVDLTADPFVDAANGDFNLNNAAGGGDVLRRNDYATDGTNTNLYPFRQYVSDDFLTGKTKHPLSRF
jgi:hypothetical protein